ncbi:MAG: hypothetical protein HKN00_05610 [Flavobacteriaceae bacterium]|nr:hypothetical protein [Bacteroidia bacterium]MBT8287751.1 hypothetical protein [Bacteroidia bacterium]NNF74639.1 hypothetical protein [Flavobacteriaceae bacterium]NNK74046.1 hypothetical protein [Flavobacteriaceae bacterium]
MFKSFISLLFVLIFTSVSYAQTEDTKIDTTDKSKRYGLRLGGDIGKLIRSAIDSDFRGFEIMGDYRLTNNWYVAGELGTEERTSTTDFLNSTAKGNYLKGGVDYNMYRNWFGMENMIYSGFRVGASTFSQTINSYSVYNTNQTFGQTTITETREIKGLNAIWGELIIGIKAETLKNLYLGLNVQLKGRITEKKPDNFENIYIPGFNRTYDSGRFGIGFGYNISYLIPFYKKGN